MRNDWWKKIGNVLMLGLTLLAELLGGAAEGMFGRLPPGKAGGPSNAAVVAQAIPSEACSGEAADVEENSSIVVQDASANLLGTFDGVTAREREKVNEEVHRQNMEQSRMAAADGNGLDKRNNRREDQKSEAE